MKSCDLEQEVRGKTLLVRVLDVNPLSLAKHPFLAANCKGIRKEHRYRCIHSTSVHTSMHTRARRRLVVIGAENSADVNSQRQM